MLPVDLSYSIDGAAVVRPVRAENIDSRYVDGLNDPEVYRFLVGPRNQRQTRETVDAFVNQNIAAKDAVLFGLFIDGLLRGTSRLHDIDAAKGTAHLGIALFDRAVWGKGWGTKLITVVSDIAHRHFGITTIHAGICAGNAASISAFRKAGFVSDDTVSVLSDPWRLTHWILTFDTAGGS